MPYHPTQCHQSTNRRGTGRPLKTQLLTPYEARQEAQLLIQRGLVQRRNKLRALVDLMSSAGVLPGAMIEDLLGVNGRTLRRYRERNILARVVAPSPVEAWMPPGTHFLYILGMVGSELAILIHGAAPTAYGEALQDKVSHDVLCNLVYYHLYRGLKPLGYAAVLYGRHEATVRDRQGKPLLEPDAMVVTEQPGRGAQRFLVEYHNEHFGTRAEEKVLKYERVLREQREAWQNAWQTYEAPTVLAVWTHRAVGTGYARLFEQRRRQGIGTLARWLGRPLQSFLEQQTVLLWQDLGTGQANTRLLKPHE